MGVTPINVARVSQHLRGYQLLQTMRFNQNGLFRVQNQLATGLRFAQPSEDVRGATQAGTLDRQMDTIRNVSRNLETANATLDALDAAMRDAIDLVTQTKAIASEGANDSIAADERRSLATTVESLLRQVVSVGNRRHLATHLFGGYLGDRQPFDYLPNGVLYSGDDGSARAIVDTDLSADRFTVSGLEFFNAASTQLRGIRDLDPALSPETRIAELRGTSGNGVRLGRILVSNGTEQAEIDLSGANTIGDLIDRLNAELPTGLSASFGTQNIVIDPGALSGSVSITIQDVGAGSTARDLGLLASGTTSVVNGASLDPVLTPFTRLAQLADGSGVDLSGQLTIRNGSTSATIDFGGAETVQDVINRINQSGTNVVARIAADGRTLEVQNRLSGSPLYISEAGGFAASLLGIRSLRPELDLTTLNDGRGVQTVAGDDLRIVTADGTSVDVDIDGARTLQDVIDRLNAAGGGAITASLSNAGDGLVITDNTAGGGTLRIERLNMSPAIDGLGLNVSATGNELRGIDVNPIVVDSPFTALLELRSALEENDTRAITGAAERLDRTLDHMLRVQGAMAAQARAMQDRAGRVESESTATRVLLSDTRDVDLTEAIVRFQQMQTALQANLATSSRVMNLSLLDYLR
jgi:flagellin-like hook-associated protein FlgL